MDLNILPPSNRMPVRRSRERGIALLEILLSVVILSTGLVLVLRPFITSASYLRDAENRLLAGHLIDEELWAAEMQFQRTGHFGNVLSPRSISYEDRIFQYRGLSQNGSTAYPDPDLRERTARVKAVLSWKTGSKSHEIVRVMHVAYIP